MKIGILGTGMVGSTIGSKLVQLGHSVMLGSRAKNNDKALEWVNTNGSNASSGTFADAASFGEIIFLCTNGAATIEIISKINKENFKNKIIIDVTNPLDFSKGMPPTLIPEFLNTNSLGEAIQAALPDSKIVKSLNTVNCEIMVNPSMLSEDTVIYMSGNDLQAKEKVSEILKSFGWKEIIDLGGIITSRGVEMALPLWICLYGNLKSSKFNFKIVK